VPERARGEAESLVRAWQADVLELVRSEGADRRTSARALAYSVNGAGLALMVLVFGATGGITGAEVGIAGGTAVLAQKLLEAVFSEDAVRRMATTARERLHERVAGFTSEHARTFTDRLEALGIDPAASHDLRVTVAHLLAAREPAVGRALPAAPVGAVPVAPARRRWREWLRGGA
jgi:hypothetical protein